MRLRLWQYVSWIQGLVIPEKCSFGHELHFLNDFLRFAFSRFVSYVLLVHFLHFWAKLESIISKAYGCAGASNCEVNAVGANSLFTEEACRMPAESVSELANSFRFL